jgi:hypothetical protein
MGGFNNPIIGGGGALVYPSIHSPDYAAGSAGWSINKDGTAEFNNVVIRNGQIVSGTAFYYNTSPPTAGSLVASTGVINNGTDAYGNAYLKGTTQYFKSSPTLFFAVSMQQGNLSNYYATSAAGPWNNIGFFTADASNNLEIASATNLAVFSGTTISALDDTLGFTCWPVASQNAGGSDTTTTLTADTTMFIFNVIAGHSYRFEINGGISTGGTGSINFGMFAPALTLGPNLRVSIIVNATAGNISYLGWNAYKTWAPGTAKTAFVNMDGIFTPSANGTLRLRFHSGSAGQSVGIKAGTYIKLQRTS